LYGQDWLVVRWGGEVSEGQVLDKRREARRRREAEACAGEHEEDDGEREEDVKWSRSRSSMPIIFWIS
jgi:hypothetical protein